jgi:hypothetical protein
MLNSQSKTGKELNRPEMLNSQSQTGKELNRPEMLNSQSLYKNYGYRLPYNVLCHIQKENEYPV